MRLKTQVTMRISQWVAMLTMDSWNHIGSGVFIPYIPPEHNSYTP